MSSISLNGNPKHTSSVEELSVNRIRLPWLTCSPLLVIVMMWDLFTTDPSPVAIVWGSQSVSQQMEPSLCKRHQFSRPNSKYRRGSRSPEDLGLSFILYWLIRCRNNCNPFHCNLLWVWDTNPDVIHYVGSWSSVIFINAYVFYICRKTYLFTCKKNMGPHVSKFLK